MGLDISVTLIIGIPASDLVSKIHTVNKKAPRYDEITGKPTRDKYVKQSFYAITLGKKKVLLYEQIQESDYCENDQVFNFFRLSDYSQKHIHKMESQKEESGENYTSKTGLLQQLNMNHHSKNDIKDYFLGIPFHDFDIDRSLGDPIVKMDPKNDMHKIIERAEIEFKIFNYKGPFKLICVPNFSQ